jgi:hypothetical protein
MTRANLHEIAYFVIERSTGQGPPESEFPRVLREPIQPRLGACRPPGELPGGADLPATVVRRHNVTQGAKLYQGGVQAEGFARPLVGIAAFGFGSIRPYTLSEGN